MDSKSHHHGTTIEISIPVARPELFSHSATADVLSILADSPEAAYGIRELSRAVDQTHKSVSAAIEDLEAVDLVTTERDGPKTAVRINARRLDRPDDPVLSIPQPEFHAPIRDLVAELESAIDDVLGIVVFGSVARGQADRRSDVDCFVLVDADQATAQQSAHEVVDDLHDRRYDGERYAFQVLVESVATATQYGDRLRDVLREGITVRGSPELQALEEEVLADGR